MREYERFQAASRSEWRDWLAAHHAASPGVWLVTFKKTSGGPYLSYDDAVEEALCFGWIDSRPGTLDEQRTMLLYTPRRPKSGWSRSNKERIERLIARGSMTPAGLEKIEQAKRDGSWMLLDAVEAMVVPEDLASALASDHAAAANWEAFGDSYRRQALAWIATAKRAETRQRRIGEIVRLAARNGKANQGTPKR